MSEAGLELTEVRRVVLKLRAGVSGFDAEPDMSTLEPLAIPTSVILAAKASAATLLAMRVRDQGMEPLFFEDDWIVIDTADTALKNGEVFAVNWNGEACVYQLVYRGGQWFLNSLHPDRGPINVKSAPCNIVGRVAIQPTRVLTGRL